jgi:hypothetical protein
VWNTRSSGRFNTPPDDFKDDLAALCRLDDNQRDTLVEWFLSASGYDPWGAELPSSSPKVHCYLSNSASAPAELLGDGKPSMTTIVDIGTLIERSPEIR